jgi:hypothetical protein
MFIGCLQKNKNISGYISNGLVEVHNLINRHSELVNEMTQRGYSHKSPIEPIDLYKAGNVSIDKNIQELKRRCPECKERIERIENT